MLEIKNSDYTERYGSDIEHRDVLDLDPSNPRATIGADLTAADTVRSDQFDCFLPTRTLQLIYDTRSALAHAHRSLRPGGVLLATVPCISRIIPRYGLTDDYWRFTAASGAALFSGIFGAERVAVRPYGNVLTATRSCWGWPAKSCRAASSKHTTPTFRL